jgi:hypothetical protein
MRHAGKAEAAISIRIDGRAFGEEAFAHFRNITAARPLPSCSS